MRFRIVLAVLLCGILSGCIFSPSKSSPYTGEPAELVVHIRRSAVAPQGVSTLAVAAQDAEPMHQVVVRIEKGNIYRVFRTVDIPADQPQVAVEVEVPSGTGYKVAAFSHDKLGKFLEQGYEAELAVAQGTDNVVQLELGPVQYIATIPDVAYSGGEIRQFSISVPNSEFLRDNSAYSRILLGLHPWSSLDEWLGIPQDKRWISTNKTDRLPQVEEATRLYYQVELCVPPSDLPDGITSACYYDPPMGSTLPSIELRPGPPPQ